MERPWLLLCRVLHVDAPGGDDDDDDDLQADAEEQGLVVDAEAIAQALNAEDHFMAEAQALNAGLEDAEHNVQAAGAGAAAVAEAEEGVQEHGAGGDADAEAQALEEAEHHVQAAGAAEADEGVQDHGAGGEVQGEADDDAAAVDAQALNAGLDEADHNVQAEEGADDDDAENDIAADDAQQLLEQSVIAVNTQLPVSQAAHAQMRLRGAGESDFTINVAPPPFVSSLVTGPGAHPDPERLDRYPYVVATGRFCHLLHLAVAPSYGTNFGDAPNQSHLVLVRHFLRDEDGVQIAACAHHVPERPFDEFENMPALNNIQSVALVCNQEAGHVQIAELVVTTGAAQAVIISYGTQTGGWGGNIFVNPLRRENRHRDWVPHGTVSVNNTACWYDLSWGIITCNLAQPPLHQMLIFHRLPAGRVLRAGSGAGVPDLHSRRCIAVSQNLLRYIEIVISQHQAATVNMWFRDVEDDPWRWQMNYSVRFEQIWGHDSYQQTGLPRTIPDLVGVSPVDSNLVYFSLNQQLFCVNMPQLTVVNCEEYNVLNKPGPEDEPVTSRYLIPWNLDADEAINVGHQPADPSDHGDSSPCALADEGEVDYESPPSS